jgi:hypothetical protein
VVIVIAPQHTWPRAHPSEDVQVIPAPPVEPPLALEPPTKPLLDPAPELPLEPVEHPPWHPPLLEGASSPAPPLASSPRLAASGPSGTVSSLPPQADAASAAPRNTEAAAR